MTKQFPIFKNTSGVKVGINPGRVTHIEEQGANQLRIHFGHGEIVVIEGRFEEVLKVITEASV